jgi:membrane-bound inhibitor of C-type lysozyme
MRIRLGKIEEFKKFLKIYKPVLGLPLSTQIKDSNRYLPESEVQTQTSFDQIMQAYSRRAVEDRICLPYITELDHLSWWYSCELNQYLTIKYYEKQTLQFNNFIIENTHHPTNDEVKKGKSKYIGGTTKDGLKQCKRIVEKKFGKQEFLIGTLFHPILIPTPVNIHQKIFIPIAKGQELTIDRLSRACLSVFILVYAKIIKAVFRGRFPTQTLLVYKK